MESFHRGYTLYELLIALLLVSILVAIAVPSFATIGANGRIRTEIDALFHAVHLARKESIMRRRVVSICPSEDGLQCSPSVNWSKGWLMFENTDRDEPPRIDPGEAILQVRHTTDSVRITANRRGFTLRATEKRATNGTLVVCDRQNRATPRALVVSYTGRPRVALKRRNGDPYYCVD
jgi:type IV fimbrial biogenesis protein FimT